MTRRNGFTVIELLVVMSITMLLAAILLPTLAHARERARYIKWAGYSHNLRIDQDLFIYYNFEQQSGNETLSNGYKEVWNRAAGNAFQAAREAIEAEDLYAQLGRNDPIGQAPLWEFTYTRWRGKGGLNFDGSNDLAPINWGYSQGELPAVSIGAWIWSNNDTSQQIIASWDRSENFRFSLKDNYNDNQIGWDTTDTTGTTTDMGSSVAHGTVADGQWHLVFATYDQVDGQKNIYVDGAELGGSSIVGSNSHTAGLSLGEGGERKKTWGYIGVGSEATSFGGNVAPTLYFDGYMDEFMLFHRALTLENTAEMYEVGEVRDQR